VWLTDIVLHKFLASEEIVLIVLTHSHVVNSFKTFPLLYVRQFYIQSAVDFIALLTLLTYGLTVTEFTSHLTIMRVHALTRNSPQRLLVFTARLPLEEGPDFSLLSVNIPI
jgi:hypothetical protein